MIRLTSGLEVFGEGETREEAIQDALENCAHPETGKPLTREWIDEQLAHGKEGVAGRGLVFEEYFEDPDFFVTCPECGNTHAARSPEGEIVCLVCGFKGSPE